MTSSAVFTLFFYLQYRQAIEDFQTTKAAMQAARAELENREFDLWDDVANGTEFSKATNAFLNAAETLYFFRDVLKTHLQAASKAVSNG